MSVKDLASEVEKLTELNNKKDDLIKALDEKIIILQTWAQENFSNICKKISENEQLHFKNEKILEKEVSDLKAKLVESKSKKEEEKIPKQVECKECSLSFGKIQSLKKHILVAHPKLLKCDQCDQTFDQNWKLEDHLKLHINGPRFQCDLCPKSFVLQWRLRKHKKGHEQKNVKFCHFFNNNKICKFEEVSGCMFRHEHAPTCQNPERCKIYKCQFRHFVLVDDESDNDSDNDNEIEEEDTNPIRCDYGLCDLQSINFKTSIDLKEHLRNQHGLER